MNFKIFLKFSKIQYHIVKVYITEDRARDMVYVHSTLRLLENIQAVNYVETSVEWEQWAVADSDCERHWFESDVLLLSFSVTVTKCDCSLLVKIKVILDFKIKFGGHLFKIQ